MPKKICLALCASLCLCLLAGCACGAVENRPPSPAVTGLAAGSKNPVPTAAGEFSLPSQIGTGEDGLPTVKVYMVDQEKIENMPIETYLQGVLAGEMKNDWPMEALKAQAILARTFAVQFIKDKGGSKYEGADVSTDIEEAQAYDASGVDERIKQAIEETSGEILVYQNEPIYAWFHSHSGGKTAMAKEGLGYEKEEPKYIQSVQVNESEKAYAEAVRWETTFTLDEVQKAIDGFGGGDAKQLKIAARGESGRVTSFTAGAGDIPAPAFRLALGGTRMRSTLIDEIRVDGGSVVMAGRGYGHGVGMSQWGAYQMAEEGMKAEEIVLYFFKDVEIIKAWGGETSASK